jgi:hypothetical protein
MLISLRTKAGIALVVASLGLGCGGNHSPKPKGQPISNNDNSDSQYLLKHLIDKKALQAEMIEETRRCGVIIKNIFPSSAIIENGIRWRMDRLVETMEVFSAEINNDAFNQKDIDRMMYILRETKECSEILSKYPTKDQAADTSSDTQDIKHDAEDK